MTYTRKKEVVKKYNTSPSGYEAQARYRKTAKYRASRKKSAEKRALQVAAKKEQKKNMIEKQTTFICTKCKKEQNLDQFNYNPEKISKKTSWCKKCLKIRNVQAYGITEEHFNLLVEKQENKCAICESLLQEGKFTHIDHNHVTGQIRGLLCNMCNIGLGTFKDNPDLLIKAAMYIVAKG